jgi:hypothetical protein
MTSADVAALLATAGLGTVDTSIFYHDWPDSVTGAYDTATLVRQYAGSPPDHAFGGPATERPGFQVTARSKTPSTAEANIHAAFDALDGVGSMWANQSPFFLGVDDVGRHVWVVNFRTVTSR